MPRSWASWLTAVGERRVSIGPPIRIIERGRAGIVLRLHARDCGEHRHGRLAHRHDVQVRPERAEHRDQVVDVVVEIEAAGRQRHHAGVGPIGDDRPGGSAGRPRPCRAGASRNGPTSARRSGASAAAVPAARWPRSKEITPAERALPDDPLRDRHALAVDASVVEGRRPACRSAAWCARTARKPPRRCARRACGVSGLIGFSNRSRVASAAARAGESISARPRTSRYARSIVHHHRGALPRSRAGLCQLTERAAL